MSRPRLRSAFLLFLKLASRRVYMRSGAVADGLLVSDVGALMRRVRTNRDGFREVLKEIGTAQTFWRSGKRWVLR